MIMKSFVYSVCLIFFEKLRFMMRLLYVLLECNKKFINSLVICLPMAIRVYHF